MPYVIRRFRFKEDPEIIKIVETLEEAQEHCNREDSHGNGWFDGYEEVSLDQICQTLDTQYKIWEGR